MAPILTVRLGWQNSTFGSHLMSLVYSRSIFLAASITVLSGLAPLACTRQILTLPRVWQSHSPGVPCSIAITLAFRHASSVSGAEAVIVQIAPPAADFGGLQK